MSAQYPISELGQCQPLILDHTCVLAVQHRLCYTPAGRSSPPARCSYSDSPGGSSVLVFARESCCCLCRTSSCSGSDLHVGSLKWTNESYKLSKHKCGWKPPTLLGESIRRAGQCARGSFLNRTFLQYRSISNLLSTPTTVIRQRAKLMSAWGWGDGGDGGDGGGGVNRMLYRFAWSGSAPVWTAPVSRRQRWSRSPEWSPGRRRRHRRSDGSHRSTFQWGRSEQRRAIVRIHPCD